MKTIILSRHHALGVLAAADAGCATLASMRAQAGPDAPLMRAYGQFLAARRALKGAPDGPDPDAPYEALRKAEHAVTGMPPKTSIGAAVLLLMAIWDSDEMTNADADRAWDGLSSPPASVLDDWKNAALWRGACHCWPGLEGVRDANA